VREVVDSVEKLRGTIKWLIGAAFLAALALFGRG